MKTKNNILFGLLIFTILVFIFQLFIPTMVMTGKANFYTEENLREEYPILDSLNKLPQMLPLIDTTELTTIEACDSILADNSTANAYHKTIETQVKVFQSHYLPIANIDSNRIALWIHPILFIEYCDKRTEFISLCNRLIDQLNKEKEERALLINIRRNSILKNRVLEVEKSFGRLQQFMVKKGMPLPSNLPRFY